MAAVGGLGIFSKLPRLAAAEAAGGSAVTAASPLALSFRISLAEWSAVVPVAVVHRDTLVCKREPLLERFNAEPERYLPQTRRLLGSSSSSLVRPGPHEPSSGNYAPPRRPKPAS